MFVRAANKSMWKRVAGKSFAACVAGVSALYPANGAERAAIPNFSVDPAVGWVASGFGFGTDFVQPPNGPGPVVNDPAYPYVTNAAAAATGKQPTFRVADLTSPILQPWAKAQMKKANDDVLAGKENRTGKVRHAEGRLL